MQAEGGRDGERAEAGRGPHAIFTHDEDECRLEPGGVVTLGRHAGNDLVVRAASVSRFHASIRWLPGRAPEVVDHGSQNGTFVDGVRVGRSPLLLTDGARVEVGNHRVDVILRDAGSEALLEDAPEVVALYCEFGIDLRGELEDAEALTRLLRMLEVEQRTGTLALEAGDGAPARVTLGQGRIVAVRRGEALRTRALEQLLVRKGGYRYRFTPDLEPTDTPMDLWFSDFLRRWERGFTPKRPSRVGSGRERKQTG
jgi:hypothetical protein